MIAARVRLVRVTLEERRLISYVRRHRVTDARRRLKLLDEICEAWTDGEEEDDGGLRLTIQLRGWAAELMNAEIHASCEDDGQDDHPARG